MGTQLLSWEPILTIKIPSILGRFFFSVKQEYKKVNWPHLVSASVCPSFSPVLNTRGLRGLLLTSRSDPKSVTGAIKTYVSVSSGRSLPGVLMEGELWDGWRGGELDDLRAWTECRCSSPLTPGGGVGGRKMSYFSRLTLPSWEDRRGAWACPLEERCCRDWPWPKPAVAGGWSWWISAYGLIYPFSLSRGV